MSSNKNLIYITIPAWAAGMQVVGTADASTGAGLFLKTFIDGWPCSIDYYPKRPSGQCDIDVGPPESDHNGGSATAPVPHIRVLTLKYIPEGSVVQILKDAVSSLQGLHDTLRSLRPVEMPGRRR
jgi:hypothetical protein